jgi:signal transduction histidine kinase
MTMLAADKGISADVQHLMHFCSSHDDVERCLAEIEKAVAAIHDGAECAVYLLDRQYQNFHRYSKTAPFSGSVALEYAAPDPNVHTWRCFRNRTVVGLILLGPTTAQIKKQDLKLVSDIVCTIYDRLFAANLFANIHIPIKFHQPEDQFFKELELLTQLSSGMCAGALREINKDGKSLTTIFAWNLNYESKSVSEWDIESFGTVPELKQVIETRQPKAINSVDPSTETFFRRPEQAKIRSAVFSPVLVGTEIFGVLSFAQHIPYEYSHLEINGFLSIANAVGIAIHNFRQASQQNEEIGSAVRNSTVFTALEVAQAARHTAKGVIDTVNVQIARLLYYAQNKASGEIRQTITTNLNSVADHIVMITKALDDIKAASKPPKNELVSYSLKNIWEEARSQLLGKLNNSRIGCRWDGPDVEVLCFPDQIRQLFLNLIINSIDAFARGSVTGKRNIAIRCEVLPNQKNIKLTYVDNAGGLDVAALQEWKKDDDTDITQLIFQKDVTTKGDEGSGWGLYICRRVMARHQGSLDVVDYRRGMTFAIQLPKEFSAD